jgi:hypothetical protein
MHVHQGVGAIEGVNAIEGFGKAFTAQPNQMNG